MQWFNIYGFILVLILMVPNIVFAMKVKDGFINKWNNNLVMTIEKIGRMGCFGFMIINIPGTCFGWWSEAIFRAYLIVNTILLSAYCLIWVLCFKKDSLFRSLALSIIPSAMFIYSGITSRSILLIVSALLFSPSHILISYKNAQ